MDSLIIIYNLHLAFRYYSKKDVLAYRYYARISKSSSYWYMPNLYDNPIDELALPNGNTAEFIDKSILRKGTEILEGTVAPNFGKPGGGYQYYVHK